LAFLGYRVEVKALRACQAALKARTCLTRLNTLETLMKSIICKSTRRTEQMADFFLNVTVVGQGTFVNALFTDDKVILILTFGACVNV
jgi:hypothetical protein